MYRVTFPCQVLWLIPSILLSQSEIHKKNILLYQSVSITMVSQFAVPGTDPVDIVVIFFRETSHRKKEMTWQKWVTRQRWMDRWDPWGVFSGDSWRVQRSVLHVALSFSLPGDFSGHVGTSFTRSYISCIWENGELVVMETCHF